MSHYTDEHLVRRGSSVDIIERCAAFMRQAGDFEGILDYADDGGEDKQKFQALLEQLKKRAMQIIWRESR